MPLGGGLMAGAIAAPIIGGYLGNQASQGDRNASIGALQNYYNQVNAISLPDTEKMKLMLQQYQSAGDLNPQQEVTKQLNANDALQNVQLDPRLQQAQMQQLETLQKLGDTGISPVEKAQLDSMRRQTEADNQSRMKSLIEQQQARGVGGGDAALAAKLLQSQAGTNRQAEQADSLASMAFQRALEAKTGAASVAGNMQNADYQRQAALANALNAREAANVGLQASTQQRNVDKFNQAQSINLQNKQNLMNNNVNLSNSQQQYNKNLAQQNYENELKKQGLMSGAASNMSNAYAGRANATAGMYAGIGSGIGQIAGAGSMMAMNKKPATGQMQTQDAPPAYDYRFGGPTLNESPSDSYDENYLYKNRKS